MKRGNGVFCCKTKFIHTAIQFNRAPKLHIMLFNTILPLTLYEWPYYKQCQLFKVFNNKPQWNTPQVIALHRRFTIQIVSKPLQFRYTRFCQLFVEKTCVLIVYAHSITIIFYRVESHFMLNKWLKESSKKSLTGNFFI